LLTFHLESAVLFKDLDSKGVSKMVLEMALASSYSGLSDLKRWKKAGILHASVAETIWNKLELK
jgi:hypothetical protein